MIYSVVDVIDYVIVFFDVFLVFFFSVLVLKLMLVIEVLFEKFGLVVEYFWFG